MARCGGSCSCSLSRSPSWRPRGAWTWPVDGPVLQPFSFDRELPKAPGPAPRDRRCRRRSGRWSGPRPRGSSRSRHGAGERQVRDHRDRRRLVGDAHPSGLHRRGQGRVGRRGRRRRDDRPERRARGDASRTSTWASARPRTSTAYVDPAALLPFRPGASPGQGRDSGAAGCCSRAGTATSVQTPPVGPSPVATVAVTPVAPAGAVSSPPGSSGPGLGRQFGAGERAGAHRRLPPAPSSDAPAPAELPATSSAVAKSPPVEAPRRHEQRLAREAARGARPTPRRPHARAVPAARRFERARMAEAGSRRGRAADDELGSAPSARARPASAGSRRGRGRVRPRVPSRRARRHTRPRGEPPPSRRSRANAERRRRRAATGPSRVRADARTPARRPAGDGLRAHRDDEPEPAADAGAARSARRSRRADLRAAAASPAAAGVTELVRPTLLVAMLALLAALARRGPSARPAAAAGPLRDPLVSLTPMSGGRQEDPGGACVAVRGGPQAPGSRRGLRSPVRRLRPLSPPQGERRAHGQRDGRARHAGDGRRGSGREVVR